MAKPLSRRQDSRLVWLREFEGKVDHRKVAYSWDLHKEAKTRFLDNTA